MLYSMLRCYISSEHNMLYNILCYIPPAFYTPTPCYIAVFASYVYVIRGLIKSGISAIKTNNSSKGYSNLIQPQK